MTPLAWLIGLIFPACAAVGAQGLPHPQLMDMAHLQRPASPNSALAAPLDFQPRPDVVTPPYRVPATRLYAALRMIAAGQPRTFIAADYVAGLQIHWVARSAILNFPDLITAQVIATGQDSSALVLYSRSVYGYSDFGVNRQRVDAWLAGLQTLLNRPDER